MSPKRLGLLALLNYKSGKNFLADPNSTIEQLTVGYYLEYKGLAAVLDSIRAKLKLTDNSYWRKSVKKLFKKKDIAQEKEKIQKKKTSFTESDTAEVNSDAKPKTKKSKQKGTNDKSEDTVKSTTKKRKKQIDSIERNEVKPDESDESSETEEENNAEESGVDVPAPTTVDDFFITADGSNYLSTAVINRNQEEDSDDESKDHQRGKGFERRPRESSFFHKDDKKPVKLAGNRFEGTKRKWTDEKEEIVQKEQPRKLDPELHPSWQAKQKLKPTITEFKGKKITFD